MEKVNRFYVVRKGMQFLKPTDNPNNPCGFWMDSLMDAERFDEREDADKWAALTEGEVIPMKETVAQGYAVTVGMAGRMYAFSSWDEEDDDPLFVHTIHAPLFSVEQAMEIVEKIVKHPYYREARVEVHPSFRAGIVIDHEKEGAE